MRNADMERAKELTHAGWFVESSPAAARSAKAGGFCRAASKQARVRAGVPANPVTHWVECVARTPPPGEMSRSGHLIGRDAATTRCEWLAARAIPPGGWVVAVRQDLPVFTVN